MSNLRSQFAQTQTLVAASTVTANATSDNLTLPFAQSYRLVVEVGTVTGTSPTLVVTLASSFDGGVTYFDFLTTSSLTTTGTGCTVVFAPSLRSGEAALVKTSTLTSVTTITPTAGDVSNGPFDSRYIKVKYLVGGTSPSFGTVKVGIIAAPNAMND